MRSTSWLPNAAPRTTSAALAAAVILCGCVVTTPPSPPPEPPVEWEEEALPAEEAATQPAATAFPLIVEVALLPEPDGEACPEAPLSRADYLEEIRTCRELGASVVRLQPVAEDSSP